ncbi:uncharacterized protein LOC105178739 [Sesamum indicum]|uniref:Uncharacterized protein LOC105178739 n=1 Tax=Sesamum indicum TaxID=4182 RepID=A0A6I9UZG0_SESIN|nr:uncharacterized protein LOC105178739 [Sesamum indicum]XP_011100576.1 uncharacterized protein LOC105178739 [Sesamum indicum]XP_020555049.1 uncharacterized protein LOC105178739 [Sesamum indicum]
MGSNIEEAVRAKAYAEKQFVEKNFAGAKSYALKAQMLCPELEGISQMVATFGVYMASEAKINGEPDFYSILGLDPSVDRSKLKKQYKKMAVLLHPDKNKTVGADGAFRLVSEAWTLLSDAAKRSSYDQRRNLFAGYSAGAGGYENCSKFSSSHGRLDTFWTVCTSCHIQYEYLRKYVNKRLSCKNCRGVFIAVETGLAPVNGSFPYSNFSYVPENGYGGHGCGITYVPTTTGYCPPSGSSGHHTGYRSEYVSNISFQGNSSGNSSGVLDPNGLSASSFVFYQANGEANKTQANGNNHSVKVTGHVGSNGYTGQNEVSKPRRGRPAKKRKVELGGSYASGHEELSQNIVVEPKIANGNGTLTPASKLPSTSETLTRRSSAAPTLDGRQLLIDKARSEIHRKLEEMRLAMEVAAAEAEKSAASVIKQPELKRNISMSITVPDSDFHDFDKDRSEECFKPKQIWALYDEEDGMPRLYCLIRDVISVKPFKVYISYLSSRSDSEFGSVNWLDCGFTKSCGSFRVFHSETVEQVNIFSHLLSREKAGRGGCVRIYPRSGDIWAVYRNWSPDWNRTTPDEVRHQYEMVEVLHDYSEESGVWVAPLIKLDGFKTVYQRSIDKDATRWIPRREMLRFSHQVPSCSLKVEGSNLPEGCWDLDPAATPEELLQGETELQNNTSAVRTKKTSETPEKQHRPEPRAQPEKMSIQSEICSSTPKKVACGACMEEKTDLEPPQGGERIPPEVRQEETGVKATAEFPITETSASQVSAEFR